MSYYSFVWKAILLIMAIAILRTLARRAERLSNKLGIQYIDCGTSGGVYGLERGYCLMVGGADSAVSVSCRPIFDALAPGMSGCLHEPGTERVTLL